MKISTFQLLTLLSFVLAIYGCKKNDKDAEPTKPVPEANFTYNGTGNHAPCNITFDNNSLNATSYLWDFGDNGTSTVKNPSHIYKQGGVYTVTLKATGNGANHSISKTVNILAAPTKVFIKNVTLTEMPFIDPSTGGGWDPSNGPDIYIEFLSPNPNNNVMVSSNKINDITIDKLPIIWKFQSPDYFLVPTLDEYYFIDVIDYDVIDSDDEIGYVSFKMENYMSGSDPYPSKCTLTQNNIKIDLELIWE